MMSAPQIERLAPLVRTLRTDKAHRALCHVLAAACAEVGLGMDIHLGTVRDGYWFDDKLFAPNHELVAADPKAWRDSLLSRHGGDAGTAWGAIKDQGIFIGRTVATALYFTCQYGEDPDEFLQFKVFLAQDMLVERLTEPNDWSRWRNKEDVFDSSRRYGLPAPIALSEPYYLFEELLDVAAHIKDAERAYAARLAKTKDRVFTIQVVGAPFLAHSGTFEELFPYAPKPVARDRRLMDDWRMSSAGISGAIFSKHWCLDTWNRVDEQGDHQAGTVPMWCTKRPPKVIKPKRGMCALELYEKLSYLDEWAGHPFAWYFFMLHGNRVGDWVARPILVAADAGEIDLPAEDIAVLRRWAEQPYGF